MRKRIVLFSLAFALSFYVFAGFATAKPFYEGKTIKLIVGYKPGGGWDFYGRLMAKFMQRYLPGSTIIVKNIPGAGSIIGCNELYHAKPDGLTIGNFNRALTISQLVGIKGVKFDLAKMSLLGSACSELYTFTVSSKFKNFNEVKKAKTVKLATAGVGGMNYVTASLIEYIMDLKNFRLITGYSGGETGLAIKRGETDGSFHSFGSVSTWIEEGFAHPVLFIGQKQPKGYENVPLLQNIVTENKYKPLVDLLVGINTIGRPFGGPPGIKPDRLTALQDAFKKACYDPELLELAEKTQRPIEYMNAEKAKEWVEKILSIPPNQVTLIKKAYGEGEQ